jgi:hypothetical protein
MTLFELLVVMTIVGVVYSIGIFTLKKEKSTASRITLLSLKSSLTSLSQSSKVRLVCDLSCKECRVWSADETPLATIHLQFEGAIERYGFDRFGELKKYGKMITKTEGSLHQKCFEYTLYPDGSTSPLLLKNQERFYLYSPLGGDKPYITKSEEALKEFIFNQSRYPMRSDDYYAGE